MKRIVFTLFILVLCQYNGFSQQTDEITQQVSAFLKAQTGYNYSVSVHSFDKSNRGLMRDPYGTLKGTYLFEAGLLDRKLENPNAIIGIFKNRKVLWHSEPFNTGGFSGQVGFGSIYRTMELNKDGEVELFVSWTMPIDGRFGPQFGWIFSWNGSTGTNITETDKDGLSVLQTHEAGAFYFVDINGDGIIEIYTERATSSDIPIEYKREFYSWNGQKFGSWSDTPQPDPGTFFPRDRLNIKMRSSVLEEGRVLHYQYTLTNEESSQQDLNEFYLLPRSRSVQNHTTRMGWIFSDRHRAGFFYWSDWGTEPNEILSGETDSSFSYSTRALPFISRYYIQGANETPTDVSFEEIVEDIKTNSVSGYTLGPADPPRPFHADAFADSLHSYTTQACELEWITNRGICNSLQLKMINVKKQLERGKTKTAAKNLQAFLYEVEARRRNHLTTEGYGLLWYNGQYLLDRLISNN